MKQAHKLLVLVALVLALTTMLPTALAYFTTNATATGSKNVAVSTGSTITEDIVDHSKIVTITNNGTQAVYVRAQCFAIDQLAPNFDKNKAEWVADGAWFYHGDPVEPGKSVTFEVVLNNPDPMSDELDQFDVTIVYETTPVRYNSSNQPYADWTQTLNAPDSGN